MQYLNLKYYLGIVLSIPLLPFMYFQGKKIRASVPKLPDAEGKKGICTVDISTKKSIQLITIGESTIAGVGVKTHEEGFTGSLAKELSKLNDININWKVYAESGYTAKDVVQKIVPQISEKSVDLIVIGLGGNDAFTLNSPKKWSKDIEQLIKNLTALFPNSPIVFCNMPPIKEFPAFTPLIKFTIGNLVELLGKRLKVLVKKYDHVFYFDEIITLEKWIHKIPEKVEKPDFFSDGVHPSKLTYQAWGKEVATGISNIEEIQKLKFSK